MKLVRLRQEMEVDVTGRGSIDRAHVSAADIASASYQPITFGGPRLEFVMNIYGKDKTPHLGVYTVPLLGGTITRVVEVTGSKRTGGWPTVNHWNTP